MGAESRVEQVIDRDERGVFVKELCVARAGGAVPLAMVRKRFAGHHGTRATVLLIHGYGQNRYAWHLPSRSLANRLARDGFDVYNLDLRGSGRSLDLGARRPADARELFFEDVPAAVEAAQQRSGPRPVFLVGHSMGGLLSYAAAPAMGDAVAGIASLGSPYHFGRGSWALWLSGWVMRALARLGMPVRETFSLTALGSAVRRLRAFVESPLYPLPIRGFLPRSMEPEVLMQHMSLAMDTGSMAVLRSLFFGGIEARRRGLSLRALWGRAEAFEALDKPLLVIAGARDDLSPPLSVAPAFVRSRARDRTYRVFPQGHIDLIMGHRATRTIWPLLMAWIGQRAQG